MIEKLKALLFHPRLPAIATGLALILGLPFLGLGFQVDDYLHRASFLEPAALDGLFGSPFTSLFNFADGNAERTNELVARGIYPWFTLSDPKLIYWRPLTVATHWVDYRLWPDAPWLMHLHSLSWFGAAVFLVASFYRRVMGATLAAGLAAILFAVDDAHALPVGWIANRNSLIALVFGVSALILHDLWRREGKGALAPLGFAMFAFALLAKEGAIAVCAYLFAYALFLDKGPRLRSMGTLAPYAIIVILWRTYYHWAGYGASGSAAMLDPITAPVAFVHVLSYRAPLFLAGVFGFPPTDFYTFSPPAAKPYFVIFSVLVLAVILPFFWAFVRMDVVARFWAVGTLLCIIPICSTGSMDRLLDFASIGAMGLVGRVIVAAREREPEAKALWRKRSVRVIYRILFTLHLVVAPLLFLGMMILFAFASSVAVESVDEALADEQNLSEKTVVLANTSNYPIGLYLFLYRALSDRPVPVTVRSLAPPSIAVVPLQVERIGESTLRVDSLSSHGASLFRAEPAYDVGEQVELPGLIVTIEELTSDGWPKIVVYDFGVPLDDPSIIWLEVKPQEAHRWSPPKVGEAVRLNESLVR